MLRAEEYAIQIDGHRTSPTLEGFILGAVRNRDAGIVDDDLQATVLRDAALDDVHP